MSNDIETLASATETPIQIPIWSAFETYNSGDLVYGSWANKQKDIVHRCKPRPVGDFCSLYGPIENRAEAWEEVIDLEASVAEDEEQAEMDMISCALYDQEMVYKMGERVCIGDEEYIWECTKTICPRSKAPATRDGFDIWELVRAIRLGPDESNVDPGLAGLPHSQNKLSMADFKKLLWERPLELGYERVMEDLELPLTIDQVWDSFFADDAVNFVSDALVADGNLVNSFTKWQPITEERYKEAFG